MAKQRRKRGRPRSDAEDQFVVDAAAALREVYGLGRQRARDLALALLEGREVTPTKTPRGARRAAIPPYLLVLGYELPRLPGHKKPRSFEGRSETIRRKHLKPREDVVAGLVALLRAPVHKNIAAVVRAFMRLKRTK